MYYVEAVGKYDAAHTTMLVRLAVGVPCRDGFASRQHDPVIRVYHYPRAAAVVGLMDTQRVADWLNAQDGM